MAGILIGAAGVTLLERQTRSAVESKEAYLEWRYQFCGESNKSVRGKVHAGPKESVFGATHDTTAQDPSSGSCCFEWQARALKVFASYQGGAIEGVIDHVWCPGQGWRQDHHSGR